MELQPGYIIETFSKDTNESCDWVVFPLKKSLALVAYDQQAWLILNDLNTLKGLFKIKQIRSNPKYTLTDGKILGKDLIMNNGKISIINNDIF